LAQIEANGSPVYLHTDHLNTPRLATNPAGTIVWRWNSDAFGAIPPDSDPDGDGTRTTIHLRFAGQYFDAETGLHYNWNRYYDPRLGRYVTSDPIGLAGGLNSYLYANANPLRWADPFGLAPFNPADFPDCISVLLGNDVDVQKSVNRQILLTIFGGITRKNPRPDIAPDYPRPGRRWRSPAKATIIVDWYGVYYNWIRTNTTITSIPYELVSLFCRKKQECGKPDLVWNVPAQKFYGNATTQEFTDYSWETEERFWFTGAYDWPKP
jgi:RHS repeat-associated protein